MGSSSEASDLHLERGHTIPLSSKVKYYFSIILMTNLIRSEITDLASRAQLKTKTTHWKMRKKLKYLLVFHPVCSCIIREMVSRRILWRIIVKETLPWIYRVGRDLWNSSYSPPFPRQLSTAVIPDTSLHKLLLNLSVINLCIFPKQSLPVSSLFLLLEQLSSHLTHTLLILGLFHYYLYHLPRIMEDNFVQKSLIYFPSMLYLVTEIPNLFLLSL